MGDRDQGAWEVLAPVPADAPDAPSEHFKLGQPTGTWTYRDAGGDELGRVMRFDTSDGKIFLPTTYCKHTGHGRAEWRWKSWPTPRPLYGLDRLAAHPNAPVIVTEGEKATDAAGELLASWVVVTSPNGSNAAGKAAWSVLAQREVTIWPDNDEAGAKYAAAVVKALAAVGAIDVKVVTPPAGAALGWDAADALAEGWTPARALKLVEDSSPALREARGSPERTTADERRRKRPPPQRNRLVNIGETLDLWHDENRECYASIEVEQHVENWPIRSRDFRLYLAGSYYDATGTAPGVQAMHEATGVIEQLSLRGPEHTPHLRVAGDDGTVYLDLGDPAWRAVEVTRDGWRVVARPAPKFIRSPAMRALPEPEGGASVDMLREFVNVRTEDDFRLVVAFLIGAIMPAGPFPILLVSGEQGSAKSTLCRSLVGLVDPRTAALRALPRDERDLAIAGHNGHLLAFDNVSGMNEMMADALCRLAAGGGFVTRELHSDKAEVLFDAQRPVILNGIPNLGTRADLADRALAITLAPISPEARRTERELFAAFENARPEILGALLDGVSSALRNSAAVRLDRVERMADFAMWVTGAEAGLGWDAGSFMKAYGANRATVVEITVEADSVASAVVKFTERAALPWEGSAGELLAELDLEVTDKVRVSRYWPGTPVQLANRLRRAAPVLRQIGIEIEFGDRATTKDRKRLIVIRRRS